ncbi:MAG: YtxH domain-containing protein [Candidatus Omnitrophica bacterium]|nr:YtxH domain-containing protein [Candidatus Omnitrophota bacterium]MBI2174753.1 YtxH domain-containing protein [Candidatus Omnitrophota bacterium]MBI3010555.1 YtxH domain-containing protein [Candidatus Omnitrophota bacterium]
MSVESRTVADSTIAFFSGVTLGAIAGLLLAPRSGKETREQLGEQAQIAAKRIRETGQAVRDSVMNATESIRREVRSKKEEFEEQAGINNPAEGM